ncbi:MAG: hypothetical protein J7J86_04765 [Bacteroidales bacterium]|nr:hypothetical protein [Bacteroidales bacterium]
MEKSDENNTVSIEKKLIALYTLQQIDSQIDKIHTIRGELPLEVQDLEDEVCGLETRIKNYEKDIENLKVAISEKENAIKESQALIKKYSEQQNMVKNNREYDSLTKEIEFQNLEIQLAEKRIKEYQLKLNAKSEEIDKSNESLEDFRKEYEVKSKELDEIVSETAKEEDRLKAKSEESQKYIEERLLTAYKRIRGSVRNGLAVVSIQRDACGGCYNKIPPQRQLDIRTHKKIIVCEYCGRILVDDDIVKAVTEKKD